MAALASVAATLLLVAPVSGCAFGQKYGQASCEASAAGQCDQISDKTLFYRNNWGRIDISYYAPDGTLHGLESTTVTRIRWRVDETGQNILTHRFETGRVERRIGDILAGATEVIDGDAAGLAENRRGFYTLPLSDEPTDEIMRQVRAR
ncbi:MAG: hypothetical protein AAFR13_00010 [Pseudomonadota bacterium]